MRSAADAIGFALLPQLQRLRPGMSRVEAPDPALAALTLPPEGEPDALSLAAVLAAHAAYVRARGTPDGVSLGALAIARLLVWAQRAALLGRAPRIAWVGPEARRPEGVEGLPLTATATLEVAGHRRSARAVALVRAPEGGADPAAG